MPAWAVIPLLFLYVAFLLIKEGVIKIRCPEISAASQYNRLVKRVLAVSFFLGCALSFRFAVAKTFDPLQVAELLANISNLLGFVLATFAVLASSGAKNFIVGFLVDPLAWALLGTTFGMSIAAPVIEALKLPHGGGVMTFSLVAFGFCAACVFLMDWALKQKSVDDKLKWSAAALVLSGSSIQVVVSAAKLY